MNISEYFDKYRICYVKNFTTSRLSSIKVGGSAKYVLYPKCNEELIESIKLCIAFSEQYKIIGGCTNTFFSDEGFDGIIICTKLLVEVEASEHSIICNAGASLASVLKKSAYTGLDIASGLYGIPGSVGGAVRNNAGAFGASISEAFESGMFYDSESNKLLNLDNSDLYFSYRSSLLQKKNIVFLSGKFKCFRRKKEEIFKEFECTIQKRRATQPNHPSLGSFFKRSGETVPSILIDQAGMKGMQIGGARVSEKHAGFIINVGSATASDVNNLADKVEKEIFKKYGIHLIREAELVN